MDMNEIVQMGSMMQSMRFSGPICDAINEIVQMGSLRQEVKVVWQRRSTEEIRAEIREEEMEQQAEAPRVNPCAQARIVRPCLAEF